MIPNAKKPRSIQQYKFWPSSLKRAGHTTIDVDDSELLGIALQAFPCHEKYRMHMSRKCKLPCKLQPTSKFRNGAQRWWCPVHQGSYGKKKQVEEAKKSGIQKCDHADDPVDFVRTSDVPEFCLVHPGGSECAENEYCELGVWIGLPPAINTVDGNQFFPGIHVHARKVPKGVKVVDTNYPAVRIKDKTGRFSRIPKEGITITSPTALEYLYYMENKCPVNERLVSCEDYLPRSKVELTEAIRCKHCAALHEDIGDYFGENTHKKHLCGQCGRDIFSPGIGNPLVAFQREFRREVVGTNIDPQNAKISIDSSKYKLMVWPSTPAVFWSREAPEIWGIHVHAFDEHGERVIDDTYGAVYLDGKQLDRQELFAKMLDAIEWLEDSDTAVTALELEDD